MVFLGAVDVDIPEELRPWAPPGPERARREREAALLVGDSIVAVRYFHSGSDPVPWRFDGFDSVGPWTSSSTRGPDTPSARPG